ncbi:MAG TPA: fatty acid desaturase [Polyangiaceae bacterium]
MAERTIASYAREIRPLMQPGVFAPARSRLWWLPVHLVVVATLLAALARHWLPPLASPILSLIIGMSFAGLTFLGHETLHGATLRHARLRHVVGWVGFLPFVVSPRLWVAWHNRVHHGNTQHIGKDPDAYPTLAEYRGSRAVRWATAISPGLGRLRGLSTPLVGFSVQSTHMLLAARKRHFLSPKQHAFAIAETLLGIAVWTTVALAVGGVAFLFGFVLPLVVANVIVMGFILTNHSLSPLTGVNDPLVNSLSVTTPRFVQWLTLGFGFHVEHHLFPAMSTRHAPGLRDILRSRWPDKYRSMSLLRATLALHRSPRVYKDPTTLIDPGSGREWPTLAAARKSLRPAFTRA